MSNLHKQTFDEYYQGSLATDEDIENKQRQQNRQSIDEIPFNKLSGDEAMEKSFMQSTAQSSIWSKNKGKTSIGLTSVIIMKSMVGVGILGIPQVAANFGVIMTIIILLLFFNLGIMSSRLLLKCKNLSQRSNYSTIGFFTFKHKSIIVVVNLIIIFSNLGTSLSELIIFGDTSNNLLNSFFELENGDTWLFSIRTWAIILISFLLSPFLIVKSIEKLKFVSLFAIFSIASFTCMVIYNFFCQNQVGIGFSWWIPDSFNLKSALASLPTVILAYNWQFNLFPVFKGMEQPTDKRLIIATILGFIQASILYISVGILGYATYGNQIQTNYLLSIKEVDVGKLLYVVLNLTFVLSSTCTLPVVFFGGRNNFIQLIKQLSSNKKIMVSANKQLLEDQDFEKDQLIQLKLRKKSQKLRFYSITFILFTLLAILAILIRNLGVVYNLLGAISCNAIQYTLPTLFYIFLVNQIKQKRFRSKFDKIFYLLMKIMLVISIILTFLCVTCEFIKPE